ncbi:MAG: helix-turn-helix domain-containing protein [Nocardioides sp.]|nr:helix-turn-helix domain-containing protein [Nocardioides sp.]
MPDEPLIDLRTLSQWLSVSESTVRKWSARGPGTGLLPTMIRVNGQIRFRPSDVRAFLTAKELR